jgi:cephalosporin hydroxylase
MTPEEIKEFEQQLRKAIAGVNDIATLVVAEQLLAQASPENINSVGEKHGKTALNYAIEFLLRPIAQGEQLDLIKIKSKIFILDSLFTRGASVEVLNHQDTRNLLKQVFTIQIAIKQKLPQAQNSLTATEKIILAVFYCLNEQLQMMKRINSVKLECEKLSDKPISAKPILICGGHEDDGSPLFLNGIRETLVKTGYVNLCVEEPYTTTPDFLQSILDEFLELLKGQPPSGKYAHFALLQFALQPEFKKTLVAMDPKTQHGWGEVMSYLEKNAFTTLGITCVRQVRDLGMFYKCLLAAKQNDGRIFITVGGSHGHALIKGFAQAGAPVIAVAPFVNPATVAIQNNPGLWMPEELFHELGCQRLDMRDARRAAELAKFTQQHLQSAPVKGAALQLRPKLLD